jgi:hypothetical protein
MCPQLYTHGAWWSSSNADQHMGHSTMFLAKSLRESTRSRFAVTHNLEYRTMQMTIVIEGTGARHIACKHIRTDHENKQARTVMLDGALAVHFVIAMARVKFWEPQGVHYVKPGHRGLNQSK